MLNRVQIRDNRAMKRIAAIAFLLAIAIPSGAKATTVIYGPCPWPTVTHELGCTDQVGDTIYVNPDLDIHTRRAVLAHERGHIFDYWSLDSPERLTIQSRFGWDQWQPEHFADRFAACHLSDRERHRAFPFATWGRDQKFCRFIRRH